MPVSLVPLCQAVCMLHDVRRGAHYHQDNCHHLLQRLILVQDYLLALPLSELQQHGVLLAKLSVLVQDVYDVFNQFADRSAHGYRGFSCMLSWVACRRCSGGCWLVCRPLLVCWNRQAAADHSTPYVVSVAWWCCL